MLGIVIFLVVYVIEFLITKLFLFLFIRFLRESTRC